MSSVCLSLVANLRCSGLRPQQAIGILVPPFVEALLLSSLIYTQKDKGRKHYLLVFDSYFFAALCLVDFIGKVNGSIANSLSDFSVVDRLVGGLSGFPILLYLLFLYIYSRRFLLPVIPSRYAWTIKILLTLLVPIILIFVELGSLLGISYVRLQAPATGLAIKFDSPLAKTAWTLLSSAGSALLILYQFITFCLSAFRVYRNWSYSKTSASSNSGRREKGIDDQSSIFRLRGIGWVAAGIKLGAIEVLLGFIMNGFEMTLSRRLLRLMGRAMLAYGLYRGLDDTPRVTLLRVGSWDSIEGKPPRRINANPANIRDLISAPVTGTFAKLSPTANAFHTMKNAPGAMSAMSKFNLSFVDEKRDMPETSAAGGGDDKKVAPTTYLAPPPMTVPVRTLTVPAPTLANNNNNTYPKRPRPQDGKRVTVAYDGKVAPVLDIRFSAQGFADAGIILKKLDKAALLASTPEETSTGSSSSDETQRRGLARSRTAPPTSALANPKSKSTSSLAPEAALKERRTEVTASQIGLAITTLSGSESDSSESGKVKSAKGSSGSKSSSNGPRRLSRPPPKPMGRARSQSVTSSQSKLHNPFADPTDSIFNPSSGSNSQELLLGRSGSLGNTSEESLAAIRRISRKFPALPMAIETGGKVVSLSEVKKTLASTETPAGPSSTSSSRKTRNRSLSQPQPVKLPSSSQNIHPISPTNSTDGDVAIRTRRRLRTHMNNISPSTSLGGTEDIQQSTATAPSTATSLFSGRFTGNTTNSRQTSRGQDEQNWSPVTPYTVDSIYSDDEYASNVIVERPIGHIARRALGIEKFLGESKEKLEAASSDGHVNHNDRFVSVIKPNESRHHASVPVDVSDIQAYRASDVMFLSPVSSTYRVRPRSNVDSLFPTTASARSTVIQPSPRQSQRGRKRSGTTDSDAAAREAFAAAWRTVVPNVASPSVSDLKNVNSVSVKKTPTLIMHRQVLSGTSMLVDEGYATHPTVSMTSLAMMEAERERGRQRSGSKSSEGPINDRDLVRKARKMRAASVDSEVY
ncbi:hypothetical protein CPB86DRAFT_313851 [Serendipita vermifera]|nr:hypothetical protein CPB86DRAFT_313851 [Serendipita vermifera]